MSDFPDVEMKPRSVANDDMRVIMGGDPSNPSWDEYITSCTDEMRPYVRAIRGYIEDNDMIGMTGQQQNRLYFAFDDGTEITYSWRAWGDLMQAIVDEREGYMRYYM